ncbi:hypothetical protein [Myceligenerans salitolerans]|uniref:hypothetical protein n=1 Tax=Myceligenerans salitolerans TaxID=1230528 RepID=UPI0027DDC66C|nr:hypothetical protein [Myceligenerans salitolerans]
MDTTPRDRSVESVLTDRDRSKPLRVLGLLALCGIGAELLAAYGDNTGDPGGIAFALVFFGALYGAPALLARDLARRASGGWPAMLLLFAALGVAEACLIDQALFATDYQGYEGWEETREATFVPGLGLSAYNAYNFIAGHIIFSFGAPVALAEAWRPDKATEPWLGPFGTVAAILAYGAAAALIISDPESQSADTTQLAVSALVVAALVATAIAVGRRAGRRGLPTRTRRHLPVRVTFIVALGPAIAAGLAEETWAGFAVGVAAIVLAGLAVLCAAGRYDWTVRHVAAVALAFLVVRGSLAFTYFPLLGDVAAGPKYLHNTVMLTIVLLAGWAALRSRRP